MTKFPSASVCRLIAFFGAGGVAGASTGKWFSVDPTASAVGVLGIGIALVVYAILGIRE